MLAEPGVQPVRTCPTIPVFAASENTSIGVQQGQAPALSMHGMPAVSNTPPHLPLPGAVRHTN